jgi:hypothetical protein
MFITLTQVYMERNVYVSVSLSLPQYSSPFSQTLAMLLCDRFGRSTHCSLQAEREKRNKAYFSQLILSVTAFILNYIKLGNFIYTFIVRIGYHYLK